MGCIILGFVVGLVTSCQQKDLIYPEEMCILNVKFVWDKARGASTEGMTLLFYPHDSQGEFWRYEIAGVKGGAVEIPQGKYTMIAVNNDVSDINLIDWPFSSASLTAMEQRYSQTYVSSVGMVYEGQVKDMEIGPAKVSYLSEDSERVENSPPLVYCYPDSIATIYNFVIADVENIQRARSVAGVLTGCAQGVLLASETPITHDVSTLFGMEVESDKSRITGHTCGFPASLQTAHYLLSLRVGYRTGKVYEKVFDVTPQIANQSQYHNVYIHINGLSLPEDPGGNPDDVGMKVDVDGWNVIEVDLDSANK